MRRTTRFIAVLFGIAFVFTALLLVSTAASAQAPATPVTPRAGACAPVRTGIEVGVWLTATVDDTADVGSMLALSASPTGTLTIAYFDATNADLKLAEGYTDAWQVSTVISDGLVGRRPSLDLDALGRPHVAAISYYTITYLGEFVRALHYARRDQAGWHFDELAPQPYDNDGSGIGEYGGPTALHLDQAGTPHILFTRTYIGPPRHFAGLLHATAPTGTWAIEVADGGGVLGFGSSLSAAGGADDRLNVAYYDKKWFEPWVKLTVAGQDAGGWAYSYVDGAPVATEYESAPHNPALAANGAGRLRMSYNKAGDLYFARQESTGWLTETVDGAADAQGATALALDGCEHPMVAYADGTAIKVALWDGFAWHFETVEVAAEAGQGLAIAIAGDKPVIAYYHAPTHSLRVAWRETITLDAVGYLPLLMRAP